MINIFVFIPIFLLACCTTSSTALSNRLQTMKITAETHDIYFTGSKTDVKPKTKVGLLLIGGGADQDDAFRWFLRRANFGDVVVLRGSGSDGYNDYLMQLGANSVTSIVVKSKIASQDPDVIRRIQNAEAIFFSGGDQSNYAKNLVNSHLIKQVEAAAQRGVPIGGTSAGLAILGEFYFPAYKDTVTSSETLADPHHERLILEKHLLNLPFMSKLITDSHFQNRDRMGRLLTFMARILNDGWSSTIRGIGLDEKVALLIAEDGNARVLAKDGYAYFLEPTSDPTSCEKSKPLTFRKILVRKLGNGETFDFKNWEVAGPNSYVLDVSSGKIVPSNGSVY